MNASVQARIAALPIKTVFGAFGSLHGGNPPGATKAEAARALARAIADGVVSMSWVEAGGVTPPNRALRPSPPAPVAAPASGPSIAAVQATADRAEQTAITISGEVASLAAKVAGLAHNEQRATAALEAITQEVKRAQAAAERAAQAAPLNAEAEVARAVREAFAPFAAKVAETGKQAEVLAVADASPVARKTALEVFGVDARDPKGNPLAFDLYAHPDAPQVDPVHIWTEPMIRALWVAAEHGRNVWMAGPAGAGKTQAAQQFAARTGRMFRRFVFQRFSTCDDFLGAVGLEQGDTTFKMGPVLEAYTTPGAVCLLDEPSIGQPGAMSVLNAYLERAAQVAHAGKVWHRAPGQMFLGADNSRGNGDTGGRFAGVNAMNTALLDRFSLVVPCTYLPAQVEAEALIRHTGCSQVLADHVIAALNLARGKVESGEIIDPPSLRQAIYFVEALRAMPPAEAWTWAIVTRQPGESEAGLAALYSTAINESLITAEV